MLEYFIMRIIVVGDEAIIVPGLYSDSSFEIEAFDRQTDPMRGSILRVVSRVAGRRRASTRHTERQELRGTGHNV